MTRVDDPEKLLAGAVMAQALADLGHDDPRLALDAFLWLGGPEFDTWAAIAGLEGVDIFSLLASGAYRPALKKYLSRRAQKRRKDA